MVTPGKVSRNLNRSTKAYYAEEVVGPTNFVPQTSSQWTILKGLLIMINYISIQIYEYFRFVHNAYTIFVMYISDVCLVKQRNKDILQLKEKGWSRDFSISRDAWLWATTPGCLAGLMVYSFCSKTPFGPWFAISRKILLWGSILLHWVRKETPRHLLEYQEYPESLLSLGYERTQKRFNTGISVLIYIK